MTFIMSLWKTPKSDNSNTKLINARRSVPQDKNLTWCNHDTNLHTSTLSTRTTLHQAFSHPSCLHTKHWNKQPNLNSPKLNGSHWCVPKHKNLTNATTRCTNALCTSDSCKLALCTVLGYKFLHFVIHIHIQKPCKLHNLSKGTKLIDLFADSQSLYNQNHSFQNRARVINADSCKTYRHDGSIKILLLEFVLERIDILIPIAVLRSVMNPGVGKEREESRPF